MATVFAHVVCCPAGVLVWEGKRGGALRGRRQAGNENGQRASKNRCHSGSREALLRPCVSDPHPKIFPPRKSSPLELFGVCRGGRILYPIQAEMEREHVSPDVVAATTIAEQRST